MLRFRATSTLQGFNLPVEAVAALGPHAWVLHIWTQQQLCVAGLAAVAGRSCTAFLCCHHYALVLQQSRSTPICAPNMKLHQHSHAACSAVPGRCLSMQQ